MHSDVKGPSVSVRILSTGKDDTSAPWGKPQRERVIPDWVAATVTRVLEQNMLYGTGTGAHVPNHTDAGKSGTTNNYRDAWMMAYSPNLVIGAWVGHTGPGNQDMNGVYGTMVGSSVLKDFINNGLTQAHFSVEAFKRPDGLIDGPPCANNANISPSASPSASPAASSTSSEKELYLPGTECKAAPTPSPTASPSPSDLLSPLPSIVPSGITPSPSPSASSAPTPTPTPKASASASP